LAGQLVVDALGSEPVSVMLFGSAARGESGPNSDVDLLVIAKDHKQGQDFRRRAFKASSALRQKVGRPVEITVVERDSITKSEIGDFIGQVSRDARTLRGKKLTELVG
ncbi:MAG: nucleotidyltransferase domain-containing protein, partial [Candidatus Nanopelagicaceae bacterium]|nr:nucleotidyltransferase domain-containing protein [Candidatus Nanopelagicaceae bacterium]